MHTLFSFTFSINEIKKSTVKFTQHDKYIVLKQNVNLIIGKLENSNFYGKTNTEIILPLLRTN